MLGVQVPVGLVQEALELASLPSLPAMSTWGPTAGLRCSLRLQDRHGLAAVAAADWLATWLACYLAGLLLGWRLSSLLVGCLGWCCGKPPAAEAPCCLALAAKEDRTGC